MSKTREEKFQALRFQLKQLGHEVERECEDTLKVDGSTYVVFQDGQFHMGTGANHVMNEIREIGKGLDFPVIKDAPDRPGPGSSRKAIEEYYDDTKWTI